MEDVAFPEVDDYLQYLSYFMQRPWQSFEINSRASQVPYGAAIFAHYLDQRLRARSDSLDLGGVGQRPQCPPG